MSRNVGTPKGAKKRADDLFSKIVRSRGACEWCGRADVKLECAHIISRLYSNTRCVEQNALCLCTGCHMKGHAHPVEFAKFVLTKMTEDEYQAMYRLSRSTAKVDWVAVAAALSARFKEIAA